MTLKYIWSSFSLGCHFHVHFSYPWHAIASHSLPAIAQLLVTVRRSALHGLCDSNSVRLSVCLSHSWAVSTWFDLRSWFLHWMVAHHSSFWGYHGHPKIRRGSPRAKALNEGGVGTNWRFSTNKPPYPKRCEIRQRLLLITNRKSYTRLVPKSTTLVDPEMTLDGISALCCITHMFFGANH